MRIAKSILVAGAALVFAVGGSADGEGESSAAKAKEDQAKAKTESTQVAAAPPFELPTYVPPQLGRPARTVGGASRGSDKRIPALYVLVPDHVGQTVSEQPSLFWYIDGTPSAPQKLQFTLLDEDAIDPQLQKTLALPSKAGIYRIDLADYGFKLDPGVEYEWSVSLLVDPNEPAKDIVATGWIDRVDRSAKLKQELSSQGAARAANVYADNSLWYDALAAASDRLASNPGNSQARESRATLLRQVGLEAPAEATN